ncbi:hypothetical protein TUM19329_35140 [Legionella antarctica]|uniref:Uncharacterized protein n=2 Tax=Legionella antarctica TaxID=2708020 RepID=A0A6F8TA83_9GAMM|nr:hypothetical protein TUM19329_35140 [Legionella antarctica]
MLGTSAEHYLTTGDMLQTRFLGTNVQASYFIKSWGAEAQSSYLSGNMSAGNLYWFMGEANPLIKDNETLKEYQENFVHLHFAYVNDKQEPCGLMLMYRQDEPKQWMLGLVKNNHLAPEARTVILLSGCDLTPYVQRTTAQDVAVSSTDPLQNPLMNQIDFPFIYNWLQNIIKKETGEIDTKAFRLAHLTRLMPVTDQAAKGVEPINFNEFGLETLLAENPILDLLAEYKIILSAAMLNDCLSEHGGLRKEIENTLLSDDARINRSILQMVVLFYEEQVLNENRVFLQKNVFAKTMNGALWNSEQVQLIPFMLREHYDEKLLQLILAEETYYSSIQMLVKLG